MSILSESVETLAHRKEKVCYFTSLTSDPGVHISFCSLTSWVMELTAMGTFHTLGKTSGAAGFDVEVQLVMKDHRTAVGLEQNQISHLGH